MTILERFRIDNRVAIVTGASSGLGVAFAQALAEAGADVVLGARREDRLADTAALVKSAGRKAVAVRTDVTDPEQCQALVDAAIDTFGRIDILVNNAGVIRDNQLAAMSDEDVDVVLDTNIGGVFNMARAAFSPDGVPRTQLERKT